MLGHTLVYCGVDRKAAVFIDTNREIAVFSYFVEPRYLTDEAEKKKYSLEGRHQGSFYFTSVGRYGPEWY